jgi:hypothetical protein
MIIINGNEKFPLTTINYRRRFLAFTKTIPVRKSLIIMYKSGNFEAIHKCALPASRCIRNVER